MSNITPEHVRAFQYVRTPMYDNIMLVDCTIRGEPGVAIVMIEQVGPQHIAVMPLFVAITESMQIDFPEMSRRSGKGGGGPVRDKFNRNKHDVTKPEPK